MKHTNEKYWIPYDNLLCSLMNNYDLPRGEAKKLVKRWIDHDLYEVRNTGMDIYLSPKGGNNGTECKD